MDKRADPADEPASDSLVEADAVEVEGEGAGAGEGKGKGRGRGKGRYLVYGVVIVIGLLCLNELAIRVVQFYRNKRGMADYIKALPKLKRGQKVKFGLMVRPSQHSKLIYDLRANMEVSLHGAMVRTNKLGFRDREYPLQPGPNTVRIVGIGDSNMFGWGVHQDKNFLAVMERQLNKAYPQKKWEIINTGTPGYNTFMKVEALRTRALQFKPDIVVLQHTINDLRLPEFIYEYPNPWSTRRLYSWDLLTGSYSATNSKFRYRFEADFKEVPPGFEYMEGEEGFARAWASLRAMRDEHGFDVVMLISHDYPVGIAHAVETLGRQDKFHSLVKLHRTDDPSLIVSKKDLHPSVKGHKLIAEALLDFMRKVGVIHKHAK